MLNTTQNLIQKIQNLPQERIEEVDDFVDFLLSRNNDKLLIEASKKISEDAFDKVWDNPEDAEYDKL